MNLLFILATVTASPEPLADPPSDPQEQNDSGYAEEAENCQEGVEDLKKSMLGLEFFLRDRKEYKELCPYLEWEQPILEVYKKEPKSYLPKACKTEKI
tara:strand:+ start:50 stop:343 length:294 start_codon:yes stop_codon:yes gene_type:complete